jgi:hypothetical protein
LWFWDGFLDSLPFCGLAKVAIFTTNVDAENQILINHKCVFGRRNPAFWVGAVGSGDHLFKQHFLYFFPLPHGHGSFRPIVGSVFTIVKFSICFIFVRFPLKDLGFSIYFSSEIS